MKKQYLPLIMALVLAGSVCRTEAQTKPQLSDFGKMWTFEHAPLDYFSETYDFPFDREWFDDVRMSSLLFGNWCSASFISPDGLILTNHHCSRLVLESIMKPGEDFDADGFYAATMEEERQAPGLYVRQLILIEDISDRVMKEALKGADDQMMIYLRDSTVYAAIDEYSKLEDWAGLEIEPVVYYSGVKTSLYGFKRYTDIRLVLIPELQLGFFGGDPDNFTYPRYSLDFTMWRVYENDNPVNSSGFYFGFNPDGVRGDEPVFVVGNPGSTERYRTMAQYVYDRDYRYRILLDLLKDRYEVTEKEFIESGDRNLQEEMFMLSNSIKAIQGILHGMDNPELMARKQKMEDHIRKASVAENGGEDFWAQLEAEYEPLKDAMMEVLLLGPQSSSSLTLLMAYSIDAYLEALEEDEDTGEEGVQRFREMIPELAEGLSDPGEQRNLTVLLGFMKKYADSDDHYVHTILKGEEPEVAAGRILTTSLFASEKKTEKFLKWKRNKILSSKDPLVEMARLIVPEYVSATEIMGNNVTARRALESKIAREMYEVFGLDLPPDATGTLRISDGKIAGYEYNGTEAPFQTFYYGMYDRNCSFGNEFPWSLPSRWEDPQTALLRSPLNFVSTLDIIGGNSGSPVINRSRELVGLVFDGNIESLPGNFIYDPVSNRAVSVHAGGIAAAMKYIYKADRILKELQID